MDRLSKHAAEARALGLSYGQYMALYHLPRGVEPKPLPPALKPVAEQHSKVCIVCGVELERTQRKYCSWECRREATIENQRQKRAQWLNQRLQEESDGKT